MQILKGVHTKFVPCGIEYCDPIWLGFVTLRVPIEGWHILLATKYSSEMAMRLRKELISIPRWVYIRADQPFS
jgi:hypothetical protein